MRRRLALAGDPVPVAERVGSFRDGAYFSVSANDVLVYRTADTDSQLTWFDRQGAVIRPRLGTGRLSRRGAFPGRRSRGRIAHESAGHDEGRPVAVRFVAGKRGQRLTLGAGVAEFPVWSPDGTAHRLLVQQQLSPSETRERRG